MAKPLEAKDYKHKLKEDLGLILPNADSKKRSHYGLFDCYNCGKEFKALASSVKKNPDTFCIPVCTKPVIKTLADGDHHQFISGIYYTNTYKYKPDKTLLVGINQVLHAHKFTRNKIKAWFTDYFLGVFLKEKPLPLEGPYEVAYVYHYKNPASDLSNVCATVDKFFLDALQLGGIVKEDNVQYCKKITYIVGDKDTEHPRVEIFVRNYKEETDEPTN